jgi:hypothetical protein
MQHKTSVSVLVTALCIATMAGGSANAHSPKKGIGMVFRHHSARQMKIMKKLHVHWVYTWGDRPPRHLPSSVQYVPMIWGCYPKSLPANIKMLVRYRMAGKVAQLLGFNEPDGKHQSKVPVARALKYWPQLEATGLPLGSPACANPEGTWMQAFMKGAKQRHYRVNFICIHSYGGPNPKAFLHMLKHMHQLYHRPLWITEFAVSDWQLLKTHGVNKYSPRVIARFMRTVLPVLNHLSYVKRYAWFPANRSDRTPTGNSALYHKDGRLTLLGRIYAAD